MMGSILIIQGNIITSLSMGDYYLSFLMLNIYMGAIHVVLRVQWITILVTIEMNFQDIFIHFQFDRMMVELRGSHENHS